MANLFFPRGEIFPPEQILDPLVATGLGTRILDVATQITSINRDKKPNAKLYIEPEPGTVTALLDITNCVVLDEHDFAVVSFCKEVFRSRLPGQIETDIAADFYIGTVAGGGWHVDSSRDVRSIVNLSGLPIGLQVATKWNSRDYGESNSKYNMFTSGRIAKRSEPEASKTITYKPGEAVGINNLAREDRQVPHKALDSPGRVVLRLFASPN